MAWSDATAGFDPGVAGSGLRGDRSSLDLAVRVPGDAGRDGAVEGFKVRTILEYSQVLDKRSLKPYGKLAVPDAYHGLMTSLATHQTLLGDAIATEDPKTLFQALYAYPIKQNTRDSRALFRDLLDINKAEISPKFQETKRFLVR